MCSTQPELFTGVYVCVCAYVCVCVCVCVCGVCVLSLPLLIYQFPDRDRPHLLTVLSRDGSFPSDAMVTTFPGVTQSLLLGLCPDSVVSPDQSPWKRCTSYSEVVDYPAVLLVCCGRGVGGVPKVA